MAVSNGAADAAAGGETLRGPVPPAPPEGRSEHETIGLLAGLLDDDGEDGAEPADTGTKPAAPPAPDDGAGDDEGEDAAPDESPASGDEPDEGDEPGEGSAIDAPSGWDAEDRTEWAKLPPSAQRIVARRESELTGRMTRATQEAAETRNAYTALQQSAMTAADVYNRNLQGLLAITLPEAQQFQGVDWPRLSVENPAEYIRLSAQRDGVQQRVNLLQGEMNRVQRAQAEQQQQHLAEAKRLNRDRLISRRPIYGDKVKGAERGQQMGEMLAADYGFTAEEINGVFDSRVVEAMDDLFLLKQAEAARKAAVEKRSNTPPRVQRPGNTQAAPSESRRMGQLREQFKKTPTVDNAASIVERWLR